MSRAIFIGISEADGKEFLENKGKIVTHRDATYLLRKVHEINSGSLAVRNSDTIERRFVAELRQCAPDASTAKVSAAVQKRLDTVLDSNEFTVREI